MTYVLIYPQHLRPSGARCLQQATGQPVDIASVFPIVAGPFAAPEGIEAVLGAVGKCAERARFEVVVTLPEPGRSPMTEQGVIELVLAHPEWAAFVAEQTAEPLNVVVEAKEHPHFWVVGVIVRGGGIPPGLGFLVDKSTARVFPQRLIDVMPVAGDEEAMATISREDARCLIVELRLPGAPTSSMSATSSASSRR